MTHFYPSQVMIGEYGARLERYFPFHLGIMRLCSARMHSALSYHASGDQLSCMQKDEGWLANRDINSEDPQGWVTGSRAIVNHPDYTYHRDCWGNVLIDSASQGNITGANSPKFWHAAKINSHIHRQIDFLFLYVHQRRY